MSEGKNVGFIGKIKKRAKKNHSSWRCCTRDRAANSS